MTHASVPPPISDARAFSGDCVQLARAMLNGIACSRCHAGLREPHTDHCLRCIDQQDRMDIEYAEFRRAVRSGL